MLIEILLVLSLRGSQPIDMIGTMVILAVATWINVTISLNIAGVDIQTTLNGIFPKVLNLCLVYLCWWLRLRRSSAQLLLCFVLKSS